MHNKILSVNKNFKQKTFYFFQKSIDKVKRICYNIFVNKILFDITQEIFYWARLKLLVLGNR